MQIKSIGIIGSGIMGSGIAQVCALSDLQVTMIDISEEALQKGRHSISSSLEKLVSKTKINQNQMDHALQHIHTSMDYNSLKGLDLVIEAATENLVIKEKILKQVDDTVDKSTIIATNTSSISITELASKISHPERLVGMHFFNPVPLMSLVEIIRGLQTRDATYEAIAELVKAIDKHPISVKNSPGFVVNRILLPMINESFFVLSEGLASPEDIDAGMKLGCNHPIGPLALADMIGIDTCLAIMQVLYNHFNDSKYRPAPIMRELVSAGRLGRKSGHGVYQYK